MKFIVIIKFISTQNILISTCNYEKTINKYITLFFVSLEFSVFIPHPAHLNSH